MAERLKNAMERFFVNERDAQIQTSSQDDVMTPEEKETGRYFLEEYNMRSGDMQELYSEWNDNQKMYECERDIVTDDPDAPRSFIALVTPIIEGQVASMTESSIEFTCHSRIPGLEPYMQMLNAAGDYVRRKNRFIRQFKDFTRDYEVYGNAFMRVTWTPSRDSKNMPSGYPKLNVPDVDDLIIDGKVRDYKDLQDAEYIIEKMGLHSIGWAKDEYGEEKAGAIITGYGDAWDDDVGFDRKDTFMLLHVWTRRNPEGNLQLIEMDTNGLVLRMSDSSKPFYGKVYNQYPYYMARMMPRRGSLYGFGDATLLSMAQDTVNKLTDELTIAAKFSSQSKIALDPRGKARISQINSNPRKPILIENPNQNIRILEARGVNAVIFNYIEFLLREAQRMSRFHDIMTGNMNTASATATQINSQMAQGNVGINDKKSDITDAMEWAYRYCLQLCLEYWDVPMWGVLGKENIWIDFDMMRNVPAHIPTTADTIDEYEKMGIPPPKYSIARNGKDKVQEQLDYDVRVVIGQGLAKGRIDLYNMVINLLQLAVPDETGVPRPIMSREKAIEVLEEVTGMKMDVDGGVGIPALQATQQVNPIAPDTVQPPMGTQIGALAANLASTVPGAQASDKRGMV